MNIEEIKTFCELRKKVEDTIADIVYEIEQDDRFEEYPHIRYRRQNIRKFYDYEDFDIVDNRELHLEFIDRDYESVYMSFPIEVLFSCDKKPFLDDLLNKQRALVKAEEQKRTQKSLEAQRQKDEANFERLKKKLGK